MREQARVFLYIVREAMAQHIESTPEFVQMLANILQITDQERMEIGEILKADIREDYINDPLFFLVNGMLEALPKLEA